MAEIKPNIIVTYLYTMYYTNKETSKLNWFQFFSPHTVEQLKENFVKTWANLSIDYSQPVAIIPGWLTPEQEKLLFSTPKKLLKTNNYTNKQRDMNL